MEATRAGRRGNADLHFIMPSLEQLALGAAPGTWSGFGQQRGQELSWTLVQSGADVNSCLTKVSLSRVNPASDEKPHVWEPSPGMEKLDEWSEHQHPRDHWWGHNVIKPFQADPVRCSLETKPAPFTVALRGEGWLVCSEPGPEG